MQLIGASGNTTAFTITKASADYNCLQIIIGGVQSKGFKILCIEMCLNRSIAKPCLNVLMDLHVLKLDGRFPYPIIFFLKRVT